MPARTWRKQITHTLLVGMQNATATLKNKSVASYTTKHAITVRPGNGTLGYLSQCNKNYVHLKISTQMFIAALFLIVKTGNDPDVF